MKLQDTLACLDPPTMAPGCEMLCMFLLISQSSLSSIIGSLLSAREHHAFWKRRRCSRIYIVYMLMPIGYSGQTYEPARKG